MNSIRRYNSVLRRDQVRATRTRILDAGLRLLDRDGGATALTNRRIAMEAGVTEMTVYRHFPNRPALDEALWRHANDRQGVRIGFPDRFEVLLDRLPILLASFDEAPTHVLGALTTTAGRALRATQDEARRAAFLSAVAHGAPELPEAEQRRAAGILQLFYSGYAWLALREQWATDGPDARNAIEWAMRAMIRDLRRRGGVRPPDGAEA